MAKLKSHARLGAALLTIACLACAAPWAQAQTVLSISAYPALDEITKAAIPAFKKKHPDVEVKITSRAFADHHTAMTTACPRPPICRM
jgi:multiple sugar transport system substrate-binding protein